MSGRPKRIRVDVRSNSTIEQGADGSWSGHFPHLDVKSAGATEEEAWENLQMALREAVNGSSEGTAKWEQYVKEFGVEEEIPEEELREREQMIEASHTASAGFSVLDADNFDKAIASERPVLVDFWAEWCMPCHMMAPVLKEVSDELNDRLQVAKLNVDDNKEFWERYSIEGIPTLILFSGGQERFRIVGAGRSKQEMIGELEPHL